MQIFEITKTTTNEGILKGISMDAVNRLAKSMSPGRSLYSTSDINKALAPAPQKPADVPVPSTASPAASTNDTPTTAAATTEPPETNYNVPALWRKQQQQQKQQPPAVTTTAPTVPPPVTGSLPQPGRRFRVGVPGSKAVYFKTAKGWTNEIGQAITKPESVNKLEQILDSGAGKEETIPKTPVVPLKKGRKGARRVR